MNTETSPGLFKPASPDTLNLMGSMNQKEENSFFIPPGFITHEAGQTGYLLRRFFNRGRDAEQQVRYKTFFALSR
ncbi:MAG: hypothetical protein GY765_02880, partial [bacterium]|nr:hypothetical protein [bacterium]